MDPQAVFLDFDSLHPADLDRSGLQQTVTGWQWFDETSPEQVQQRMEGARIVVSNKVVLDRDLLVNAPDLEMICIAATGYNHVDLQAARDQGIAVSNVTAYATPAVAQHVFTLMLALTTNLMAYRQDVVAGAWQQATQFCRLDHPISELAGKTLGIVGYGELGKAVARLAEAFGMKVLIADRPGGEHRSGRIPLDDLLPQVDVLSLHVPLADNTRNLIGRDELALMKSSALLINTARGGLVEEGALADALLQGQLGGAGIDVLSVEPPREGNVLLDLQLPNLLVTPHVAWASQQARQRLLDEIALNIRAFQRGDRRNRLD